VDATLLSVGREALLLVLLVSAPPLVAALAAGVAVGIFQAATQVQDAALAAVPRLVATVAALGIASPWIAARLCRFAAACLELAARGCP
jgi:flagellar biosynthesis protein FliQ